MAEKQPTEAEWARWQWELRLPLWQRRINRFCENWIFAFFIAMLIRHFVVEAYRIPTASMEPMLYGDPAFRKADHVVVDKLLFRFTGPERWGVTVFQFPWPEVAGPQGPANPIRAWNGHGDRSDSFPLNPQLNRNFVKRCVVKPGDRFYISGGDIYIETESGWQVPGKPAAVQEALWMPIYQHLAAQDYVPWQGVDGAWVEARDEGLAIAPKGGGVRFSQPLTDLYLKPGLLNVRPMTGGPLSQVQVSMTEPLFTYQVGSSTVRSGNIWDTKRWHLQRLTSADIDNPTAHGTTINNRIGEQLGDLRIQFAVREITGGAVTLSLSEGDLVSVKLELAAQRWRLLIDGAVAAEGTDSPINSTWQLTNCDNRVSLARDGVLVADQLPVAATDPNQQRTRLLWTGDGQALLSALKIDRELHYSPKGILSDETRIWRSNDAVLKHELVVARQQMIRQLIDPALRDRLLASLEQAQAGRASSTEWLQPLAVSPETAIEAPADGYLLLGDNSLFSWDGRNWGWVPAANLRGEVLSVVFPFGRAKWVQ